MIYIWRLEISYTEKSSMQGHLYITPRENLLHSKWISVHSYQLDDKQLSLLLLLLFFFWVIYIQFLLCRLISTDSRHPLLLLGDLSLLTKQLIRENSSTFLRISPVSCLRRVCKRKGIYIFFSLAKSLRNLVQVGGYQLLYSHLSHLT